MALTGFNPELVSQSINGINNAYEGLINQLGNRVQIEFVNGLADKWACREAQDFFNLKFKPFMEDLIRRVNLTFQSVVETMNFAASKWAMTTGSQFMNVPFNPKMVTIDTSAILENVGGVRGIDFNAASSVINSLQVISTSVSEQLQSAINAVTNSGFIGGGQEEQLVSSLNSIKASCERVFSEVTEAAKLQINATLEKYSTVEGQISQAFVVQNM